MTPDQNPPVDHESHDDNCFLAMGGGGLCTCSQPEPSALAGTKAIHPLGAADVALMDAFIAEVCQNGGQHSKDMDAWCETNKALWVRIKASIEPTPAALADTKVLPRFPGYREMGVKEVIVDGDMRAGRRDSTLHPAPYIGHEVGWSGRGLYFRPIDPVPHTDPKAPEGNSPKAPAQPSKVAVIIGDAAPGLYIAINGKRIAGAKPTGRIRHEWTIDSTSIQDALPKPETEFEGYPGIAHDLETARARISTLTDALTKAQGILTAWLKPDSNLSPKEVVRDLIEILDAPALVQALKGGEA